MATFIPNVTDVFPEPALFTPDFSFMDKMLQRRQSMYDQGWSQLTAAYNFVNKDLTHADNIKDRDNFLKQAKNNLKGLAGMDLSQHQNVMSARGVFEPWVNNKKALGDASLTSHWKQQESIGEGYRLDDGGKYFNQFNVDYIRKQRAAFAGDASDSWEDYWKSKRSYNPYYDYHKEVEELMKNFKPSSVEIDRVNGLYKYTTKNADWTNAEIRKYLDANLSSKAKQQMKIEADVTYNNSPQQMGQVFLGVAKNEMAQYDAGIAYAKKQLSNTTKPEEVTKIKEYISSLEDRKKDVDIKVDAINKGDFSFVKKKGEDMAMNIFYNQYLGKVSNGWSHADHSFKIDADEVSLAIYKENRADQRQERKAELDKELARLKGEIAPPAQMNTLTLTETEGVSLDWFQNKANGYQTEIDQLANANKGMVATWKSTLPENKGKEFSTKDITAEDILAFKTKGNNGKPLPLTHAFYSNENRIIDIEGKIKDNYSNEKKQTLTNLDNKILGLGSYTLNDGTTLTSSQILNGFKSGKIKVSKNSTFTDDDFTLNINGKDHRVVSKIEGMAATSRQENTNLMSLARTLNNVKNDNTYSKFKDDITDYFAKHGKELTYTANLQTFSKGSYEAKTLEAEMYNMFPEEKYAIQHAGLGADARSQGSAFFYINGKGDFEPNTNDVKAYLNQRGYTDVEAIETTGTGATLYKINNFKSPIVSQYNQFKPVEKAIILDLSTEKYSGSGGRYTTSKYTSNSDRTLQIKKEHNQYYLLVQGLEGGNTMDQYPQAFNDPSSAVLLGQYLTAPSPQGYPEANLRWYIDNVSNK
jgi:hypothetical protein